MNEKETTLIARAICLAIAVLTVALCLTYLRLYDTQKRLAELERGTSENLTSQQKQLDDINENIDEINANVDSIGQEITSAKTVQKNTNRALTRVTKRLNGIQSGSISEAKTEPEETVKEEHKAPQETTEAAQNETQEVAAEDSAVDGMTYMGTWEISAYEWSDQPCANGNWPTVMHTCAFNEVPFGTTVYVDGLGYFVNEDICGTPGRLDIFLGDIGDCKQFGIQHHDVYIAN